jgi:hypothetical protein
MTRIELIAALFVLSNMVDSNFVTTVRMERGSHEFSWQGNLHEMQVGLKVEFHLASIGTSFCVDFLIYLLVEAEDPDMSCITN